MMERTRTLPQLAVEVVGRGEPVLFIMGFGMRRCVWRPQVEGLKAEFRVATFDNRGIGDSEPGPAAYRMQELAEDALRVADHLGWERFHVVGVSLGGMIGQELALLAPARVATLSLLATQPGGLFAELPPLRSIPRVLGIGVAPKRLRIRLQRGLLHPKGSLREVSPAQLSQRTEDVHGGEVSGRARRRQLRAVFHHDTRARLGQIACPTLVVQPALDRLCRPKHSETLAAAIPNATLVRLENTGHGLVFHNASGVNEAIRTFLKLHPIRS